MLVLKLNEYETFDETTQEFTQYDGVIITLNYSLEAISKWEQLLKKPYLVEDEKTAEDMLLLLWCMQTDSNIAITELANRIDKESMVKVRDYIQDPHTATKFREASEESNRRITTDLIYYWMTALQIPFECQHWHLNRLMSLIKVCNVENSPKKKMSTSDIKARNRAWKQSYRNRKK